MLAIFRSLPRLKDPSRLKTYAFRIAHNCCVDHVVRHAAMPPTQGVPTDLSSEVFSPEQILLGHERTHSLVQAVRQLELPYRQVMTLLLEDLSYIEIAETLGMWVMRTYSGHSSARASNLLYRSNLAKGQTGLSIAFDLPTQIGYDPDAPKPPGRSARSASRSSTSATWPS